MTSASQGEQASMELEVFDAEPVTVHEDTDGSAGHENAPSVHTSALLNAAEEAELDGMDFDFLPEATLEDEADF